MEIDHGMLMYVVIYLITYCCIVNENVKLCMCLFLYITVMLREHHSILNDLQFDYLFYSGLFILTYIKKTTQRIKVPYY